MFEQKLAKSSQILLRLACRFFAVKLGITDEQFEKLKIDKVVKFPEEETGGLCSASYSPAGELRTIHIKIKSYASDVGMIDVIAHEMVHAKQNLDGHFSFETREVKKKKWFGLLRYSVNETVRVYKGQILEDTPYYEQLAEQEAYTQSRELTRQFLNFVNLLEKTNESLLNEEEEGRALQLLQHTTQPGDDSVRSTQ